MKKVLVGVSNKVYSSNNIDNTQCKFFLLPLLTTYRYFNNIENVYFLIISLFQLLTHPYINILPSYWSPTGPYSTIVPLILCLVLDMLSDLYRWVCVFIDDWRKNNKKIRVWDYKTNRWSEKESKRVYPGDIVAIQKDQIIPMDILLIDYYVGNSKSSYCKINLANLNGESYPMIVERLNLDLIGLDDYRLSKILIEQDNKNSIGDMMGTIYFRNGRQITFTHKSLLINGANILTEGCLGVVVNCGKDCKLQSGEHNIISKKNDSMNKISSFMMSITIYILVGMIFVIDYYTVIYETITQYFFGLILKSIQSWIILNGIIPFSIKILLSVFRNIQSGQLPKSIKCINPYIIDQVPHIDYILSDKTGTITKNKLELVRLIDSNQTIYDLISEEKVLDANMMIAMGLCIGVNDGEYNTPEDKSIYDKYIYLNSKMSYANNKIAINAGEKTYEFTRLEIEGLSFSQVRPISSQLFFDKSQSKYFIYTKGSITRISECLLPDDRNKLNICDQIITETDNSLRLLGFAYREIPKIELENFLCKTDVEKAILVEDFEKNLTFLGIFGIQDSLITGINEHIIWLKNVGLGMGILTGDRKITALSIAKNASLIDKTTRVFHLENIGILRKLYLDSYQLNQNVGFLFSNNFVFSLIENPECQNIFCDFLSKKPTLIGYSLTPQGKKAIVDLIEMGRYNTLSIGDGFNDTHMLSTANVGVAVSHTIESYSDFRLDSFMDLKGLFIWGYHFSQRNQILSIMTMFKSCSIAFLLFWLIMENGNNQYFNFIVHQGFHLIWCIIHPYYYCILSRPSERAFIQKRTRNILSNISMFFWIFFAFIESSLLYYSAHNAQNINLYVFYLVFQINLFLLYFDVCAFSVFIQFINLMLVIVYLYFSDDLLPFLTNLPNYLGVEYLVCVLLIKSLIIRGWKRYLKL